MVIAKERELDGSDIGGVWVQRQWERKGVIKERETDMCREIENRGKNSEIESKGLSFFPHFLAYENETCI